MTLQEALNYFGNGNRMAKALKVSRNAVYKWDGIIPIKRQLQIQFLTKGELKADLPSDWTPNL
jgi:hypothetical protein